MDINTRLQLNFMTLFEPSQVRNAGTAKIDLF